MDAERELRHSLRLRGYERVELVPLEAGDRPAAVYRLTLDPGPTGASLTLQGTIGELRYRIGQLRRRTPTQRRPPSPGASA